MGLRLGLKVGFKELRLESKFLNRELWFLYDLKHFLTNFFQASAKNESDRGQRARARGIAKQKDESESSDDSSSEVDEPEDKGGRRSKVDKSESEADADEEASSRESSQRPNTRKSEGGNNKNALK